MPRSSATRITAGPPDTAVPADGGSGISRRDMLLDAAGRIVAEGHADEVTMDTVATRAGVSRALVYKHFANRQELLAALYERESSLLHRQLSAAVSAGGSLEGMLRALVEGALAAQAGRSATFVALSAEGARPAGQGSRQRRRNGQTVCYFAEQAVRELDIDPEAANPAMRVALAGIASVLDTWRRRPTADYGAFLADTYVAMVIGGLRALPRRSAAE